jgi:hypothetical protein
MDAQGIAFGAQNRLLAMLGTYEKADSPAATARASAN